MWKHLCKEKGKSGYIRGVNVRAGRLLRPLPTTVTSRYARVLAGLRSDVVSLCIQNDDTITALGEQLCFKLGHSRENDNVIRCEIRAVARPLLEFRSMSGNKDAEASSLIAPASFQDTVKAARKLGEFDEETQLYKKPSYSIKVGHSLKKMALILVSKALMTESNDLEKKARDFLTLYEARWGIDVATHAHRSLYQGKRNAPKLIPLTSDVVILSNFIKEKSEECLHNIEKQGINEELLTQLSKLSLTHLTLFNRRRQGEVSKMKMTDYAKVRKGSSHVMEDMSLKNWEKRLICKMWRVELVGKRGQTVPLMMTDLMKKSVDTIVASRVGIPDSNPYLFAVPGTESHFRGCDALREISRRCGAQKPELLRSTQLRKHIATITQIMNLQENNLDILSQILEQNIRASRMKMATQSRTKGRCGRHRRAMGPG
eukprot:XP_011672667.1 PREDICTED: uncharacterized protein LOC105442338 [Strongylocentrotus purpuratus]